MALVRYRTFRTRGAIANYAAARRVIADGYTREVFPLVKAAGKQVVATWRVDVEWDQAIAISPQGIVHHSFPTGFGANAWRWVSRGVSGRMITVKKTSTASGFKGYKPALSLQKYNAFTSPGGFFGGTGMRYGPVWYRKAVWWPGIAPRNLEHLVYRLVRQPYNRIVTNIVRRAIRAAQREGY